MAKNILICQPGFQYRNRDYVYLPYLHAILKSYANRDPLVRDSFEWLEPIYHLDTPESYLEQIKAQEIHVLGLSSYIWNWSFNLEIASMVKKLYPNCLIVAGGPQPDYNDKNFFREFPFIDLIVKRDGEEPFYQILLQLAQDSMDLTKISGLVLKYGEDQWLDTGAPIMTTDFNYYPYRECGELFSRIIEQTQRSTAILETNRGCPYTCSFCDIGAPEFNKLRLVPEERVREEMQWMAEHRVTNILCTDSNFGIMPRDLIFTDELVAHKQRTGFPLEWEYDSAKMNVEANHQVAVRLWKGQLITKYKVPWQHLDEEVLSAIRRKEPNKDKKATYAKLVQQAGIRCRPELILGMPGDTPRKFADSIYQIFEYDLSDALRINLMLLLPNAPANNPEYRRKWNIQTVAKPVAPLHVNYDKPYNEFAKRSLVDVMVGTSTFTPAEWVDMMTTDTLLRVFHSVGNLTKYIAYYLRRTEDISFAAFYEGLMKDFAANPRFAFVFARTQEVRGFRERYLHSEAIDFYDYRDAELSFLLGGSEYYYARLMESPERLYAELFEYVSETYPQIENSLLADLFQYQREILITADYDYQTGKRFSSRYNWPEYFARILPRDGGVPEEGWVKPELKPTQVLIQDQCSNYLKSWKYNWADETNPLKRRSQWLGLMVREWNHWAIEGTRVFQKVKHEHSHLS